MNDRSNIRIDGRYVRHSDEDSAELTITCTGRDRVRVSGIAFWGKTNPRGPNIGQVDFEAPIEPGSKVVFEDDKYRPYKLTLTFTSAGATAEETLAPGYFGANVSFAGEFRRV